MENALYAELTDQIDEDRLCDYLCQLVSIKSENPFEEEPREGYREKEIGQFYAEKMHELGMEVQYKEIRPGRPNVFGIKKGSESESSLMIAGHLDTVDTIGYDRAYDTRIENGNVYGRGSCDMKGALAVYLELAHILNVADVQLKGTLIVGGIADEEYQMIGSKDVGMNGPHANQGIIGEPSDLDICPANKGQLGTLIRTFGRSVHSSVPEKGINAIVHMAKVIEAFSDYHNELLRAKPHTLLGHGRFSPGVINGGTIVSTVPDGCELEVDRRILPGETRETVYEEYRRYLEPLKEKIPEFKYQLTKPTWDIPANDVSPSEPVVQSLLCAHESVLKRASKIRAFTAATDAPNMGFPTVICGPGSIPQAHSLDEYISVDQLIKAAKIYVWSVLDLLL